MLLSKSFQQKMFYRKITLQHQIQHSRFTLNILTEKPSATFYLTLKF